MFYRAMAQAVIIIGLETLVLSAGMERTVKGTFTVFLRQITGKRTHQMEDKIRSTAETEKVRETTGTQSDTTDTGKRQGIVAQWVALWQIFEVSTRETNFEEGGRRRDAWCHQETAESQITETLEEIFQEFRRRRRG